MPDDLAVRISDVLYNVLGAVDPNQLLEAAQAVIDDLELTEERMELAPMWVPDLNDDGTPIMNEQFAVPLPKSHLEWVTRQRYVTPYVDVGERMTSEELNARLQ